MDTKQKQPIIPQKSITYDPFNDPKKIVLKNKDTDKVINLQQKPQPSYKRSGRLA